MRTAVALLLAAAPLLAHAQGAPDAGTPAAPRTVAGFTLMRDQLQHPAPHLPDWFRNAFANETVNGTYKVCLSNDGRVSSVTPVVKIGFVDDDVMRQIQMGWVYKPQPVPVCFVGLVRFQINGAGPPAYRLPSHFRGHILAAPTPKLSASVPRPAEAIYKVCFNTDGTVVDVRLVEAGGFDDSDVREQIRAHWRLDVQPAPVCMAAPMRWTP